MDKTVIGLFETRAKAETAVQELIQNGCSRDSLRIEDGEGIYNRMRTTTKPDNKGVDDDRDEGFFSEVRNFFEDLGFVDPDGSRPSERSSSGESSEVRAIRPGEVLLLVEVDEHLADAAADVLNKHGAIETDTRRTSEMNVSESGTSSRTSQVAKAGTISPKSALSSSANSDSQQVTIPVMEEELQIGKRAVTRGGVRIYSRVVEKPIEKDVRLKEESVHVERHAVDRPVTENELNTFKEGTIEVKEMAEQAVIAKRARVKEEITVSKDTTERTEKVRDTVRNTEVDVSKVGAQDR